MATKQKVKLHDELMFPNQFLSAVEFKGRDVTLTIKSISKSDLQLKGGGKQRKPVITFEETDKKLVLNVTNSDSIAQLYGFQAADWVGKRITLFPTTATFGRDTVDAIRVREVVPPPKGQKPQSPPVEDGPPTPTEPPPDFDEYLNSMNTQPARVA